MSSPSDDRGLAQLFELATPDLYRRNAFRMLGLEVDSETRDARRLLKKIKRLEALGLGARTTGGFVPLKEAPSQEELQQAQQRIQDPVSRLVDEFFWFWKQDEEAESDEALELLRKRKNQDAHKLFKERESQGDPAAIHNLAVLYHLTALDLEERAERETLSEADRKTRDSCWQQCYPRWKRLLDDRATWQRVRARITELDDPRLTHELVSQIRESLEEVILLVSARLAVRGAEKNQADEAARHVSLMKSSGFSSPIIAEALRRCLAPIDLRIRNFCQKAEQAVDADATVGLKESRQLLSTAVPHIRMIDQMLPGDDAFRVGIHDEVAKRALLSVVAYGNKTDEWNGAKAGLQEILAQLSPSEGLRQRIEENLKIVSDNAQGNVCHYCGKSPASDACAHSIDMHGDVETTWTGSNTYRVTWKHTSIKIPRCPMCKAAHAKADETRETYAAYAGCTFFILLALAIFIGWSAQPSEGGMWALVIGTIVAMVVVCGGIGAYGDTQADQNMPSGVKGQLDYDNYPVVASYRAKGWTWGASPPDNNSSSSSTPSRSYGGGGGGYTTNPSFNPSSSAPQCPDCGTSSYWNGSRCTMCGYVRPGSQSPYGNVGGGSDSCPRCNSSWWDGRHCRKCDYDLPASAGGSSPPSSSGGGAALLAAIERAKAALARGDRNSAILALMGQGFTVELARAMVEQLEKG